MNFLNHLPCAALLSIAAFFAFAPYSTAQDASGNSNWSSSSQQQDPSGNMNPLRTREVHTESNGKTVDRQSLETLGPDGRYVPYRDTETETVHVNASTVRTIERTYGRGPDGQRTLIQVKQEDTRTLPGGAAHTDRTLSSPDANGNLQVARRESQDARDLSAGVRDIKTTVLTPDVNGGFTPAIRMEERQTQAADGTIQFKKSTSLSDGNGRWQLSEVREGTRKTEAGQDKLQDERVLRPDSSGNLTVVERTVSHESEGTAGKRETVDKYSTTVPGASSDGSLQLVQRETTVRRATSAGGENTTRQIEKVNPASPSGGVHLTGETIDIVRPDLNGVARQSRTVLSTNPDGSQSAVWVDVGKTDNPAAIQVDTRQPPAPQKTAPPQPAPQAKPQPAKPQK